MDYEYIIRIQALKQLDEIGIELKKFSIDSLTQILYKVSNSILENKKDLKHYHSDIIRKIDRFGLTNYTLVNLTQGTNMRVGTSIKSLTDIFSIYSVLRYQIETYLSIYYLYFMNNSEEDKNFNYDVYRLQGLIKHYNMSAKEEFGFKTKKKISGEIEELKLKIQNSNKFKEIPDSKNKRNLLRNPKAIKHTSIELINFSGIHKYRFIDFWNLYSNHLHGEHISDRQYNSYLDELRKNKNKYESDVLTSSTTNCIYLTMTLIDNLIETFELSKKCFQNLKKEEKIEYDVWKHIMNLRFKENDN